MALLKPHRQTSLSRRDFLCVSALAGLSVFSLSGCRNVGNVLAGGSEGHDGENPFQVIVSIPKDYLYKDGFDPLKSWGWNPSPHIPLIQSTLVTFTEGLGYTGDLAESIECSPEGLEWVFTLRDDAHFTNGRSVNADDVAFTLESILGKPKPYPNLSSITSVEAIDSHRARITLSRPDYSILASLSTIGIVPKTEYSDSYGSKPIGSGMFKLTKWEKRTRAILDYNEDYYGQEPLIKRLVVAFVDKNHSFSHAQAGDLDLAYLNVEEISASETCDNPDLGYLPSAMYLDSLTPDGYKLVQQKATDVIGISLPLENLNDTRLLTNHPEIRQAIHYGINRRELVQRGLFGFGEIANSICDYQEWSSPSPLTDAYDPSKAKAILDSAGWNRIELDGIRSKNGIRAEFLLGYSTYDTAVKSLASMVKDQLASIGIGIVLFPTLEDDHAGDSSIGPSIGRYGSAHPWELIELHTSKTSNTELRALAEKAYAAKDYPALIDAVHAFQKELSSHDDYSFIWLANVHHAFYQRVNLDVSSEELMPKLGGWGSMNHVCDWSWRS